MQNKAVLVILTLLAIFVLLPFLVPFGIRVANDFPLISQDFIKLGFSFPSAWKVDSAEGMGQYGGGTLWSWPISILFGLLGVFGFSYMGVVIFGLILPILILGAFSINKFLAKFEVAGTGRVAGGLFYLANTYTILLIDGGQLSIALAYAIFPLIFLSVIGGISGGFRQKIISAVSVTILGAIDIRMVFLLAVLVLPFCIYEFLTTSAKARRNYFFGCVSTAITIAVIYFLLNSYWIFTVLLTSSELAPPSYKFELSGFVKFFNSFAVLQPQWYRNVFGKVTPNRIEFLIIPALVFLAPLLNRKAKKIYFWLIIAIVSIFAVIGSNPPFGGIYTWAFRNIPGFSFFKDSTKFFFLLNISYAFLIGVTVSKLTKYFKYTQVAVVCALVVLISPVYLDKMTGMFSPPVYQEEFSDFGKTLELDNTWGRVLWLPSRAPLGYADSNHPFLEGLRIIALRPFAVSAIGNYEVFNFLREAPFMGELFDIAGIRYIVNPYPDTRREDLKPDEVIYYHAFSDQLGSLPWIDKKVADVPVSAFRTKSTSEHFFLADNIFSVVGSDKIYSELVGIPDFSLRKNAFVFVEESPETIKDYKNGKVILYDKNEVDLIASLTSEEKFIFPSVDLPLSPELEGWPASNALHSNAGWWKRNSSDLIWWRDFLQTKYNIENSDFDFGGGYAIAEGDLEHNITSIKFQKGNKLLARVMTSGRGGKVEFLQNGIKIGEIETKIDTPEISEVKLTGSGVIPDQIFRFDKADFAWFEVGEILEDDNLTIKTRGEINVVNSLLSVESGDWEVAKSKVDDLKSNGQLLSWSDLGSLAKQELFKSTVSTQVSYTRITPSHYKVTVKSLKDPGTLVFSETFDKNWTVGEQSSTKLYSLVNGFSVSSDGTYDVLYSPQKYISKGIIITIVTFGVLSTYFLYTFLSAKKN